MNFFLNSVLNALRGKSDGDKVRSNEVQLNDGKSELCGDCAQSGRCLLNDQLSAAKLSGSVAGRKAPISIKGQRPRKAPNVSSSNKSMHEKANEPINDLENWVPHNLPKLKHETCPFHQIRSVG